MSATYAPRASLVPSQQHTNVVPGAYFEDVINITGDSSYPAGGYSFTNTELKALYGGAYSTLVSVDVVNNWVSSTPTMFIATWNPATNKVMAMAQAVAGAATAQVDVTATTSLAAFTCSIRIRFI